MRHGIAALVATTLWSSYATAQSVLDFYKGKTIQLAIGFGPGASYDSYARVLAEFLGRHTGRAADRAREHGRRGQPSGRELALQCGA